MPECKHLQSKRQWEEYNQPYISNQNESSLLKVIMVMWREFLTSSKERACPNVKKNQSKWYASTKMRSDMIMPRCKLTSLWSIANEMIMPQYKAISEMTKLRCCSHKCLCPDPIVSNICQQWWEGYAPINTSNQSTQSYLILQCEINLITSKEQLCLKNHHRLRNMPLCKVHQMKYTYHVSCSNVKNDVWSPLKGGHNSKIHHRLREVCPGIMAI